MVLVALLVALLMGLVSYHSPRRQYIPWGIGLLILATSLVLLVRALGEPSASTALMLLLVLCAVLMAAATFHSPGWAWGVWWVGVLIFLLGLPFLGAGRGDLAVLALISGPGLLMLVAVLQPSIPARLARLGAPGAAPEVTAEEMRYERARYTRLAGIITFASLAGVWLFGGVPHGPVIEASEPLVVNEQLAQQGEPLFQQYGCAACHSVNGNAGVGPTLKGVAGHSVRLDDGKTVNASEEYIRESILQPDAKTVNGFSKGVMAGAIGGRLSEISQPQNLSALVEYVKSLGK